MLAPTAKLITIAHNDSNKHDTNRRIFIVTTPLNLELCISKLTYRIADINSKSVVAMNMVLQFGIKQLPHGVAPDNL